MEPCEEIRRVVERWLAASAEGDADSDDPLRVRTADAEHRLNRIRAAALAEIVRCSAQTPVVSRALCDRLQRSTASPIIIASPGLCGEGTSKEGENMRQTRALIAASVVVGALSVVGTAAADSNPYPHDFMQNNMGYCAPYLAHLTLPDGSPVRPFINHTVQALTAGDQSWLGYDNYGDFASSKAQSTTDTQCIQRTF